MFFDERGDLWLSEPLGLVVACVALGLVLIADRGFKRPACLAIVAGLVLCLTRPSSAFRISPWVKAAPLTPVAVARLVRLHADVD